MVEVDVGLAAGVGRSGILREGFEGLFEELLSEFFFSARILVVRLSIAESLVVCVVVCASLTVVFAGRGMVYIGLYNVSTLLDVHHTRQT